MEVEMLQHLCQDDQIEGLLPGEGVQFDIIYPEIEPVFLYKRFAYEDIYKIRAIDLAAADASAEEGEGAVGAAYVEAFSEA